MHASSTITFVDEFVQNQANTNMTLQSINVTANATNGVMASMKQRATMQYPLDNAFAFLEVLAFVSVGLYYIIARQLYFNL